MGATLYYQGGPIAALLYPATEERIWTFERYSYYIHHVLLLTVPIYLHQVYSEKEQSQNITKNNEKNKLGSPKQRQALQPPFSLDWFLYAYGIWLSGTVIVHWISYYTMANINISLCPADGVPGYGENYRLHCLYWLIVIQLTSAVIYAGVIKLVSYLSIFVPKWSSNCEERYESGKDSLETIRKKIAKEE